MTRSTPVWTGAALAALVGCNEMRGSEPLLLDYDASHPIAISRDGNQLVAATGSKLHNVALSKPGGGAQSATTYFRLEIATVAISADGSKIAAGGYRSIHVQGGTVRSAGGAISSGGTIADLTPEGMVWSVDFSPDGKLLASSMGVYDTSSWELIARLAPDETPRAKRGAAAPMAKPPATSSVAATAAPTASAEAPPQGSAAPLASAAPSAAATASAAPAIQPSVPTAKPGPKLPFFSADVVTLVRFHQDGKGLMAVGGNQLTWLDTSSWQSKVSTFTSRVGARPMALCTDGTLAVDAHGQVELYRTDATGVTKSSGFGFEGRVEAAAFSADCSQLALGGHTNLAVYDVSSGVRQIEHEVSGPRRPAQVVNLAWTPDGKAVYGTRADNTVERFAVGKR